MLGNKILQWQKYGGSEMKNRNPVCITITLSAGLYGSDHPVICSHNAHIWNQILWSGEMEVLQTMKVKWFHSQYILRFQKKLKFKMYKIFIHTLKHVRVWEIIPLT